MKKLTLLLCFTLYILFFMHRHAPAQAGEWVWITGSSTANQSGNYGVQGIPDPANNPPSTYEACEWTDLNGNFWMFGGAFSGEYGDLWKYDPVTNEWTWMKGSGIAGDPGNYGVQGISSPSNYPPSRSHGMNSWVDTTGNLWMFGGSIGGVGFCDLWRYTISNNEWTWIKGPNISGQPGVYGTQGIPDILNNPGGRAESGSAWTDDNGDLWLFGGSSGSNRMNDLWRYNIASNEWTWMKGSQSFNQPGTYGTPGVEAASNTPGARMTHSHWKDHTGKLWLMGGGNYLSATEYYNDLWRYNLLTNNWAWMAGSNSPGAIGVYGASCLVASNKTPGARYENRAAQTDPKGNFWLFGGAQGNITSRWNDLWMYCVSTNQWMYVNGDSLPNPAGNWGTLGVSSPFNSPNGRAGPVSWIDNAFHLYIFGGYSGSYYNDLWKFSIDTACGTCPMLTGTVENNPPEADELFIFPNPANSSIAISFSSTSNQPIELRIYDMLGKQIYFSKEEITKGKFEKEINVEKLGGGIYFLQLKTKEGNKSRKVIINH